MMNATGSCAPYLNTGRLLNGSTQEMAFGDGTPKGLEIVLRERGVNTDGLNKSIILSD